MTLLSSDNAAGTSVNVHLRSSDDRLKENAVLLKCQSEDRFQLLSFHQ